MAAAIAGLILLGSIFTSTQQEEVNTTVRNKAMERFNSMDEEVLFGTNPLQRIFVINVDGVIASDDNNDYIVEKLKEAEKDNTCLGVILHVNSPGGSVYASERVAKAIKKVQATGKPVYSVMQEMAASGGYYISAPCDKIYASNETWTGSIGVIIQNYSLEGLFDEYGIKQENITTGKMKDAGSVGRDMSNDEKEYFQGLVDSAFGRFVKEVADGREMSEAEVRKLADGRVYDGAQALDNGLVDEIGDLEAAAKEMAETYNLSDPMVVEKNIYYNYLSKFFPAFQSNKSDLQVIQEMMHENDHLPMYLYGGYYD